jgi:hypothetical protein
MYVHYSCVVVFYYAAQYCFFMYVNKFVMMFSLEAIPRLLNLQLQRQRCSRQDRY